MRRRIAPVLLAAASVLALSSCMKLDADITVHEDETVSGTMTMAISQDVVDMLSSMGEELGGADAAEEEPLEEFFAPEDVPEGATVEPYEDGDFVGQTMTFDDITLDQLTSTTADTSEGAEDGAMTLEHEGDRFVFGGELDLTAEEGEEEPAAGLGFERLWDDADLSVTVTFPGEVTEANGEVDGDTVTWRPKFGERLTMKAEARDSASLAVWPVVGAVAVVLVLAGLVGAAVSGRRKRARSGASEAPVPVDA